MMMQDSHFGNEHHDNTAATWMAVNNNMHSMITNMNGYVKRTVFTDKLLINTHHAWCLLPSLLTALHCTYRTFS